MSIGSGKLVKGLIGLFGGSLAGAYYGYEYNENKKRLAELTGEPYKSEGVAPIILGVIFTGLWYGMACADQEKQIKLLEQQSVDSRFSARSTNYEMAQSPTPEQSKWRDSVDNRIAQSAEISR